MRVARAFRLPIIAAMAALALSGCMRPSAPVAVVQPPSRLSMRWPTASLIVPPRSLRRFRRRRISALREAWPGPVGQPGFAVDASADADAGASAVARRSRCVYAVPAPMPVPAVAYDAAYHLDAGDRLRVVVYGQEGLTNTYAIDAGGSITMPLIGTVPARGRTPARSRRRHHRQAAQRLHPRAVGGGGDRSLPAVLHPRRSRGPRPVSLRAQHDASRARWRSPAASRRAPGATASRSPIPMPRARPASWCRSAPPLSPGDTVLVGERWF